ncbi:MAG: thioesterase family protein, partial [Solirubrobacterales bacterium]|nr:thioesterase family protein [Solirubrobacterales bacterium]
MVVRPPASVQEAALTNPPAEANPPADTRPAFFRLDEAGRYMPHDSACSPWGENMLHGRLLAALAARAADDHAAGPDDHAAAGPDDHASPHPDDPAPDAAPFTPVRLTIDLFRAAPMEPIEVSTRLVRDGGRVRVVEVSVGRAGAQPAREYARASVLLLRAGTEPPGDGDVWQPPAWKVPAPEALPSMVAGAGERAFLDMRPINQGGLQAMAQKQAWIREIRPLVEGEQTTPFQRAVAASDLVNPFGNFSQQGLSFIN